LAKAGLKTAPRADRDVLLRRVTLDLTGLPPTPQEIDAFVSDETPTAYEKAVDRLLASPRYGERMTLFWMDLARYGDSSVYHADGRRDMWAWRDGVIRSFNQNQRFDQFTIEQIAGDLLPGATVAQKVASGFNRNHATTDEGGVIAEEYRVEYVTDRVKTVSNTWLAVSFECSQCHDHKYDPISQREYYQFYAFFNNTKDAGMQTRGGNSAPIVSVPDTEAATFLKIARDTRKNAENQLAKLRAGCGQSKAFGAWLAAQKSTAAPLTRAPDFFVPLDERDKANFASSADGQLAVSATPLVRGKRPQGDGLKFDGKTSFSFANAEAFDVEKPFTLAVWVQLPAKGGGPIVSSLDGGAGFQFSIDDDAPTISIKAGPKQALKVISTTKLTTTPWQHVVFRSDGSKTAEGITIDIDGRRAEIKVVDDAWKEAAAFAKPKPLQIAAGANNAKFNGSLDDLCFYRDRFSDEQVKLSAGDPIARLLANPDMKNPTLQDFFLRTVEGEYVKTLREWSQTIDDERKLMTGDTSVMIMEDLPATQMRPTFILNRGQYDQPLKDKQVKAGVPKALPPMPAAAPENRLGLAQWLVQPEHPLTARVAMNRFWQLMLGEGLVRTTEDFGMQGEMPSHPELLDWLAVDFTTHGWDVKRAIKQIVMSETYCQHSRLTPALREADPENRLLSRGSRMRLQGEFIRDGALFVSGLLVDKIGGRSVKPYQPVGVWEEVTLSTELYDPEHGDKLYRRSMYTYWKRSAPHPAMMMFDAPSREKCTGYRPRTNTPLQALVTLNDPQFVEAARAFAQRIVKNGGASSGERIQFAFKHALGRGASPKEVGLIETLLASQRSRFEADSKKAEALLRVGESPRDTTIPAIEHAAWTMVASTLLNLDEFLVKN
ncbi:MAG: DUF1553 domain-containing protein, partial [Planctomycetota bacterium]